MAKKKFHRLLVTHRLAECSSVPTFLVAVDAVIGAIGAGATTWFPDPDPSIATATAELEKLKSLAALGPGSIDAREAQQVLVRAHMDQWQAYVQKIADANPSQAAVIIAAAGMFVKGAGGRQPQGHTLQHGKISGTVRATAPALPNGRGTHKWQVSTDGGKTYADGGQTSKANIILRGLTPGILIFVRHQAVIGDGAGDWSDPLTIIVL
jgi:hypothetical protein